jgi:molybdopterin-guanine dinucleotide biosynthesis protein B
MNLIHIIGRKNNGKTTLIVELVQELRRRGVKVGTLKHSGHEHELDTPGKDSYRHHAAGGDPAVVMTRNKMAVYIDREPNDDSLALLAPLFSGTDVVLVEGYIDGPGIKIEVWRDEVGTEPLINERNDIVAVVTNDSLETRLPVWSRKDIAKLADNVVKLAGLAN